MDITARPQTLLWTCEAGRMSPEDAAKKFATEHWAQPRKIRKWEADRGTFQMVGGTGRVYTVRLEQGTHERPAVFQIVTEEVS